MRTDAAFAPTRWSVVLRAQGEQSPEASVALEMLCRNYWPPIYAYLRRSGHSPPNAEDLTQAFFTRLLAHKSLAEITPGKGKFRSFLLVSLKNFLANEWDKARAAKRGGGQIVFSLDDQDGEQCYQVESKAWRPDELFDRRWALSVLDRALAHLREEYAGKETLFQLLKHHLTDDGEATPYAAAAATLGVTEGAIKVAAHRLRRRYREILRAEIAETVGSWEEVDEELRHLFAVLSR